MAGPIPSADLDLSTSAMRRVLQYEPRDLTVSVEAGLPWAEFSRVLAANRQMVPLDPPFTTGATVGGVLASNSSGPRRRLFGTARDLVIGMKFATLEGKLVQSGGMVVKNVAGLDMGKLMIGSFGTLAAIAVANFKVLPMPQAERHWVLAFDTHQAAGEALANIRKSVLQPASLDLLNPAAAQRLGLVSSWIVSFQTGGNAAVIERYQRELKAFGHPAEAPEGLLGLIREFIPSFLATTPDGVVLRASCLLAQVPDLCAAWKAPAVARAGTGVVYGCFPNAASAEAARGPWKAIIDFAPESEKTRLDLWPSPGSDFETMKRVKNMFDPHHLLNRGRFFRLF